MYSYSSINDILLAKFPELKERYSDDLTWINDTFKESESKGETVVFDRCFCDFMGQLLIETPLNKPLLKRIFTFIEDMAKSDDADVRDLLQVTVLEYIRGSHTLQSISEKMMGTETKSLFLKVKDYTNDPIKNDQQ